jgi:hypothetical protein
MQVSPQGDKRSIYGVVKTKQLTMLKLLTTSSILWEFEGISLLNSYMHAVINGKDHIL